MRKRNNGIHTENLALPAIDWEFINYPYLSEYDPFIENIPGEPRCKELMERVKHEWEKFKV